jgi:predicted acyl esterase
VKEFSVMIRKRPLLSVTALGLILTVHTARATGSYQVTIERGVSATMRDGVALRADVYRPKAEGQFPVLLQRTPYNKSSGASFGITAAARGFVVIIQDVRGRYTSEGEFYTFKHESNGRWWMWRPMESRII